MGRCPPGPGSPSPSAPAAPVVGPGPCFGRGLSSGGRRLLKCPCLGQGWTGTGISFPVRWTPGTMWAWSGTPSAWSGWTERRWSFPNGSSPSTTAPTPFRPGLERASPIRSSPTASAAPVCPIPPAWWGGAAFTPAGSRSRCGSPMPAARCATGISSAALWRGWRKSWTISRVWGWRPSTSAPSSRRRRITATAPPTTSGWTPCWVPTRTSRTSVPPPGPGASG